MTFDLVTVSYTSTNATHLGHCFLQVSVDGLDQFLVGFIGSCHRDHFDHLVHDVDIRSFQDALQYRRVGGDDPVLRYKHIIGKFPEAAVILNIKDTDVGHYLIILIDVTAFKEAPG